MDARDKFPLRMGRVSRRELAGAGYERFEDLVGVTERELLAIHGVGPKAIRILAEELALRGMSFTAPPARS